MKYKLLGSLAFLAVMGILYFVFLSGPSASPSSSSSSSDDAFRIDAH